MNPVRHCNFSNGVNRMVNKINKVNAMSNGVKRFLPFIFILALALGLTACSKSDPVEQRPSYLGVEETGYVLDITDKVGQTATLTPGDVLYLKLEGEADSNKQWTVTSPTSGDFVMLKDHQVIGLNDAEILDGKFTDEWWIKIETVGNFNLGFAYGFPDEEAEEIFRLEVISR